MDSRWREMVLVTGLGFSVVLNIGLVTEQQTFWPAITFTKSQEPLLSPSAIQSKPKSEPSRTVRMRVTAYCPCPKCCGKSSDGITANGHVIQPGDVFVAADKRYAFGTEMVIAGYNYGLPVKVLDRGGAIKGDKLDVFFPTHQEALEWGVEYIDVSVL